MTILDYGGRRLFDAGPDVYYNDERGYDAGVREQLLRETMKTTMMKKVTGLRNRGS